jgi:hypothetical protein
MYNIAINYIISKYKEHLLKDFSYGFKKRLAACNSQKQRNQLMRNINENDYQYSIPHTFEPIDYDDKLIVILLRQYYFSINIKKELEQQLIKLNLVDSK